MFINDIFGTAASATQQARRRTGGIINYTLNLSTISGAIAHYRSDDLVWRTHLTASTFVAGLTGAFYWPDRSGYGNHLTQSNMARAPLWTNIDTRFGSGSSGNFFGYGNSTSTGIMATTGAINGSGSQTGFTVVMMYTVGWDFYNTYAFGINSNRANLPNSIGIAHGINGAQNQINAFCRGTNGSTDIAGRQSTPTSIAGGNSSGNGTTIPGWNKAMLLIYSHNQTTGTNDGSAAAYRSWLNGSSGSGPPAPSGWAISGSGPQYFWSGSLMLGGFPNWSSYASGSFAECCFFNRQLTVAEMQQIQTYASATYKISQSYTITSLY
jgi:hypothetical protein